MTTMKTTVTRAPVTDIDADLLVCAVSGEARRDANVQHLDGILGGRLLVVRGRG